MRWGWRPTVPGWLAHRNGTVCVCRRRVLRLRKYTLDLARVVSQCGATSVRPQDRTRALDRGSRELIPFLVRAVSVRRRELHHIQLISASGLKSVAASAASRKLEARPGIEPGCEDLQSSTSPLRHRASMRTAQMLRFGGGVNRDVRAVANYPGTGCDGGGASVCKSVPTQSAAQGMGWVCDGLKSIFVAFPATMPGFTAIGCNRGSAVVFRMRPRRPARDIFGVTRAGGASTSRIGYIPESAHLGGLACISRLAQSSARDTYRRDN